MNKILTVLLIAVAFFSCAKKDSSVSVPSAETKAIITNYVGAVNINGKAIAEKDQEVKYGDSIETGSKSMCVIQINEKSVLVIKENTGLIYKLSDKDNLLELKSGWLAGVTKKLTSKDSTYMIQTPTSLAAVRGTTFCSKVENPDSTYFCVCNGKIELKKDNNDTADLVVSAHHAARRFIKGKDGAITIEKNPGLLYHDDAGAEAMAKLINETIDWTKAE